MVILCDIQNNYYGNYKDTDEEIDYLLKMIEENEMKFIFDKLFNVIKVMTLEQYDMQKMNSKLILMTSIETMLIQ